MRSADNQWDFMTLLPESLHQVTTKQEVDVQAAGAATRKAELEAAKQNLARYAALESFKRAINDCTIRSEMLSLIASVRRKKPWRNL
jgi:hypothetical protein